MTKFEEEFDKKVDIFNVIGNHNSMCCEVDRVKEVFKDWQPQQALPVVPECVGNFLKGKSIFGIANGDIPDDVISWVQGKTCYVDLEKIISHLISIKIIGYTVEKPQLFYLKNKITGMYLSSDGKDLYEHHKNHGFKFTQEDINSLDTGSYELVPVEDGE